MRRNKPDGLIVMLKWSHKKVDGQRVLQNTVDELGIGVLVLLLFGEECSMVRH